MIIGAASQKRNGKDTVCNYLVEILNNRMKFKIEEDLEKFISGDIKKFTDVHYKDYIRIGFADAVKEIFCKAFNKSLDFVEEWKTKDEIPVGMDKSVRDCLKMIGDGFREMRSTIWIDKVFEDKRPNKIISDCRYINEIEKVKSVGGLVILLWRPGFENDDKCRSESQIKSVVDWFLSKNTEGDVSDLDRINAPRGAEFVDIFLKNNGTIEKLYEKVDTFVVPRVT